MHMLAALLALPLALGSLARATTVYVTPLESRAAQGEDAETTTDLLKNAVDHLAGFSEVESAAKAQIVLKGRLLKLGSSYLVSVKRTDGLKPSGELKVSAMDEMNLAAQRLVRQVLVGGDEAPRVGEVTRDDEHETDRRIQATHQWTLGFGPAWTSNLRDPGVASVWSLGYLWGIQTDYELTVLGEFLSSSKSQEVRFGGFAIGMNYLFSRTRHAPFALAEFGYGWAAADHPKGALSDEVHGWQLGVGLGYKFFRTSNVNLAVALRHEYMMATVQAGLPSKTSLKVILYF